METLIKYRVLTGELNKTEKNLLLTELISNFGIEFIITSTFDHFSKSILQLQPEKCKTKLNDVINIVTNIIESRTEICINKKCLQLDKLPPELIGKTASYLKTREYLLFQQLNRNIYIGCNAPPQIQSFDITEYYEDIIDRVNWKKYSQIRSLNEVIFPDIVYSLMTFDDRLTFTNLTGMVIGFNQCANINDVDVDAFLQLECINFKNIKQLSVRYIGYDENDQDPQPILNFLSAFTNIEHLELHAVQCLPCYYTEQQLKLFPNLKGLRLTMCDISLQRKLVEIYSDQLDILICDEADIITNVTTFPKIKELEVQSWTIPDLINLINGTNVLEKINLHGINYANDDHEWEDIIMQLIVKQPHLEYLAAACDDVQFHKLCKSIIKSLFIMQNEKKKNLKRFKIILSVFFVDKTDVSIRWNDISFSLKNVSDALMSCFNNNRIKDFMLCCKFIDVSLHGLKKLKHVFENKYILNFHQNTFTVSTIDSRLTYQDEIYLRPFFD